MVVVGTTPGSVLESEQAWAEARAVPRALGGGQALVTLERSAP